MAEKGLRPSNRNERKLMDEVEGMEPKSRRKYAEGEGLTPGSPIVTDDKKKKPSLPSYKKGGTVKKTGLAMVHKGERVIPTKKKETAMERFVRTRNAKEAKGKR
jgi:hypothetical protein